MVKFLLFGIFVGATMIALMDAQLMCNPALIDPDGSAVCPTGTTLNSTASTCCYTDTSGCLPALEEGGLFICPTTLTLNGTVCCPTTTTNTTNTTCVDLIGPRGYSDCPSRSYLCNNTVYFSLMTQQCPRTCGRCTTNSSTSVSVITSTTCVDLAAAGRTSDCPSLSYLCTNTAYRTLMRQQCPRTCGFCTTTG